MDRRSVGLVVLLLGSLLVPVGGVGAGVDGEGRAMSTLPQQPDVGTNEAVVRTTFSLADTADDEVRVVKEYFIGEEVSFLSRAFPYAVDDVSTTNMRRDGDRFRWDGSGSVARIEYVADASVFGVSPGDRYVPGQREGDFAFLERGRQGPSHDAATERHQLAVAGEGYAGSRHVVLGPHETHTRTIDGVPVTLVVPARLDLDPTPDAVLDGVADTDRRLDVAGGDRVPVSVFAMPLDSVAGYSSDSDIVVDPNVSTVGTWGTANLAKEMGRFGS